MFLTVLLTALHNLKAFDDLKLCLWWPYTLSLMALYSVFDDLNSAFNDTECYVYKREVIRRLR